MLNKGDSVQTDEISNRGSPQQYAELRVGCFEVSEKVLKVIADEIDKTGFPLEIFVSRRLEEKSWKVRHSTYYKDYETQEYREIDIRADKTIQQNTQDPELQPYTLCLQMNIQCRKSESDAWVFFMSPVQREGEFLLRFLDYFYVAKSSSLLSLNLYPMPSPYGPVPPPSPVLTLGVANQIKNSMELGVIKPSAFRCLTPKRQAKIYKEVKYQSPDGSTYKSKDARPTIYDSSITVTKSTEYDCQILYGLMHLYLQQRSRGTPTPQGFPYPLGYIQLFLPVIVFDGELVAWSEGKVERADQVLLQTFVPSRQIFLPSPPAVVVKKEGFEDFLRTVDEDLRALSDEIHKNKNLLDTELTVMIQQFRT